MVFPHLPGNILAQCRWDACTPQIHGFVLLGCVISFSPGEAIRDHSYTSLLLSPFPLHSQIFSIFGYLTSVSSSPPVRPWAGAVRAALYFQLLYRSCALSSHAGICVPAVATAETQGKSSLCHYLISLCTVGQSLLGSKWSMICRLRAFQTSKYFLI